MHNLQVWCQMNLMVRTDISCVFIRIKYRHKTKMGNASNKVSKDMRGAGRPSTSLFNSQDVKVVKDILGRGHSEYTARRILEEAEKMQLKKVKHQEDSKNWIHSDWKVQAGLKIEEVEPEAKEPKEKLFIPSLPKDPVEASLAVEPTEEAEALETSSQGLATEEAVADLGTSSQGLATEEAEALETSSQGLATEEASEKVEPKVEVCVIEGENESAVLYITQPTASIFKGSSKYGNNSQAGSYVVSETLSEDYEMDGGGFMRMANEDD